MAFRLFALVLLPALHLALPAQALRIVVSNDDWILSDTGFASAPDTGQFAVNLADFLTGGSGSIHAYTSHFGATGSSFASALSNAGYTYTTGTAFPLTLPNLSSFDAIIFTTNVSLSAADVQVFIDYANAGGGLYIYGGISSVPSTTADALNPILNAFGVNMEPTLNNFAGVVDVTTATHPLFNGVSGLYHDRGNPLTGAGLQVPIAGGEARFAVIPEPSISLLVAASFIALAARRLMTSQR